MKERVEYLDILKTAAIFLVVFCHFVLLSETVGANLCMSACWAAVPVFFMVNGALLFKRPLDPGKHVKKTVGVYLVLVAWKCVYLLTIPPLTGGNIRGNGIWAILNYLFLFGELPEIINGHLWFIEALLAVYLVFPLLWAAGDWPLGRQEEGSTAGGNGRKLLWMVAVLSLLCTNGLYSLSVLGEMLRRAGIPFGLSFDALAAFQPFGKYGNMLGFFLLGALMESGQGRLRRSPLARRVLGTVLLAVGLFSLWGVKWFLSRRPEWDGVLLQEGYRHLPVILMAVGLFWICQDVRIRQKWLSASIRAVASRTLGIFYIHWIFGWMLTNPLAGWLVSHGISFGVWTNLLKNIVLIVPAFAATLILEKIPVVRKLTTG